jgi:hypothetical protein
MNTIQKHELKHMGLNAYGQKLFLVRYKGFTNVMAENEITDWCKEVDELSLAKDK